MTEVVIIGAGPAGLASAACLSRRGIPYTLLEQGPAAAAGLRRVDPQMTLFSPARLSRLPGMKLDAGYPTFLQFVAALDRYREEQKIELQTGAEVIGVERRSGEFVVSYRDGQGQRHERRGTHVISATGIVSAPRLPEDFDAAATSLRWLHSLDVRAEDVAGARRLLVVGGGASAADVLATWLRVRRPDDWAWISLRSPLRALPHRVLGVDLHYLTWLPEHLPAHPIGPRILTRDGMLGLTVPRAIKAGVIEQVPGVDRYQPAAIRTTDGRVLEPDLLVLATGFRATTPHLGELVEHDPGGWPKLRRCESLRTRRLYLVGARFGRTLASPYLRGIARDARHVAGQIARDR